MNHLDEAEDPRRRLLIQALAAGIFGSRPTKLPAGQSIYRISGQATVNGKEATPETRINSGYTGTAPLRSALQTLLIGGIAAAAAFVLARAIS